MEFLFASAIGGLIENPKSIATKALFEATGADVINITRQSVSLEFLADIVTDLQKRNNTLSQTSPFVRQENFAENLFKVIMGDSWRFEKASLFLGTVIIAVSRQLREQKLMVELSVEELFPLERSVPLASINRMLRLMAITFVMALSALGMMIYLLRSTTLNANATSIDSSISALATLFPAILIASIVITFISRTTSQDSKLNRRLRLWNFLGNRIGIDSLLMHKVAETHKLPMRSQTYNYFITKIERAKQQN